MDWGDIAGFVGLVALLVGAVLVARNRSKDELIETQQRLIEGLRAEMNDKDRRCADQVSDLQKQVSHLSGKVDVLSEQQGAAIGAAIAPFVAAEVMKAVRGG